jgi:glycosyltransferase involved in cell wall biosynthesis
VTAALGIPYVVVEASLAQKRAGGAWALGHRAVEGALRQADRVIGLNPADCDGVLPALVSPERWTALAPFVDAAAYRPAQAPPGPVRLIAVAMMRPGDKLASYAVLADALAELDDLPWTLDIVGDGSVRAAVAAALSRFGARVRFAGALDAPAVADRLAAADLFVWPAINEAFGMAVLEAQASALPVVAGAGGGVGGIVADGVTGVLTPPGDAAAFAAALRRLILDPERRGRMGAAARAKVLREHDLPVAAARLSRLIAELFRARAA